MPITNPPLYPITTCFGADSTEITDPIPVADPGDGAASFDLGFPPQTKLPLDDGGVPPSVEDVNGICNILCAYVMNFGAGQILPYSSTFATAASGYAEGAIVAMASGLGFWYNNVSGNTTDPDTGGANWVPLYTYGSTTITGLTTGTVTLTITQAASETIILQGTLTGNVTLIVPNWARRWTFINECTYPSSDTITVQYATGSGSTVVLPQPDSMDSAQVPMGVRGDGTNLFTEFASIYSPQFQGNPTAPTVSGTTDNSTKLATTAFVQAVAALKASLSSPNFTGTPTAPTAAVATDTTQVATCAFAIGSGTLIASGKWEFPSGLILCWYNFTFSGADFTGTWADGGFTNACFGGTVGAIDSSNQIYYNPAPGQTNFTVNGGSSGISAFAWAIGW